MINHLITSSLLLLFLLLLSVLLEKRVSPCLKYTLWLLAVIKLLIPLPAFGTHISVLNIVNQDGQGSVQQLLTGSSLHLSSNTSTQPDDEQISKKNNASRQLFEKEIQNQKNQGHSILRSHTGVLPSKRFFAGGTANIRSNRTVVVRCHFVRWSISVEQPAVSKMAAAMPDFCRNLSGQTPYL